MTAEQLRRILEVNLACGDIGETGQARMRALIAAAEARERPAESEAAAA